METGLIAIVLLIVLVLSLVFFVARNRGIDTRRIDDYRTFFIIGAAFIPIGIATDNWTFSILGLIFLILGVTNKDKWLDNQKI